MATLNLSASAQNARLVTLLSEIGPAAILRLYTGPIPLSPDLTPTGNLLASLTCGAPFGVVSGSTLTANAIAQSSGLTNGVAGYARILTQNGIAVLDLDVGLTGSGTAIVVNSHIVSNAPVLVSGLVIVEA